MEVAMSKIPSIKTEGIKSLKQIMEGPKREREFFLNWAGSLKEFSRNGRMINDNCAGQGCEEEDFLAINELVSFENARGLFSAYWKKTVDDYPDACPDSERNYNPYLYPIVTGCIIAAPIQLETVTKKFTLCDIPFLLNSGSKKIFYYEIYTNPNYPIPSEKLFQQFKQYAFNEARKFHLNAVTIESSTVITKKRNLLFNENFRINL
jgi:hypothetical protein